MLLSSARRLATKAAVARSATFATAARVFPNFTAYGSDSAFQVSPIAPQYTSGGSYLKTKRLGSIMLSWAKATSSGYNYSKKTFFSLSPSEVGLVLELLDAKVADLSLSHSANMNASDESNTKVLQVTRASDPDGNPLVLLKIAGDMQAVASLNAGEQRALRELLVYSLPRLYGFQLVLDGPVNLDGDNSGSGGNGGSDGSASSGYRGSGGKPAGEWPF